MHIMQELPTINTDFLFEKSQDFNRTTHVSQLQAGGPVIPGLTSSGQGLTQSEHYRIVMATRFTMVMNTISTLWAATQEPHRKGAGLVLLVLVITSSQAIWLSSYLNSKIGPGKRYRGTQLGIRLSQRDMAQ